MRKLARNAILLLLVGGIAIACGEKFLTLEPLSGLTEESFFSNEKDAQAALAAAYDALQKYGAYENEFLAKIEWLTVGDMRMEESPADRELEALVFNPNNSRFFQIWQRHYQGVARANTVIQRVPEIENIDPEVQEQIVAQAKFLRALFYFGLTKYFGDVPLVTREFTAADDFNVTRTPQAEVFAQIEQDLTDAANVLPDVWDQENSGRATSTAALALLAKVHLHQGEWQDAVSRSEALINKGVHALERDPGNTNSAYRNVFSKFNEQNEEIVFATQYRDTDAGGWGQDRDGHFLAARSAPRGIGPENAPFGGWSNWVPEAYFVETAFEPGDERRIGQIIGPGETHDESGFTMPDTVPPGYSSTGYICTKYWWGAEPNNSVYSSQNIPVLRYAEVLLNYAEALNEVGRTAEAVAAINEIRSRAGLEDFNSADPAEVLDQIFKERRVEMFWEMSFFTDLNRRGMFVDWIQTYRDDVIDGSLVLAPYITQPDYILLPIPTGELDRNPNLTQNPHY
ncbi:MAG: RagB/SusD family nutrient uptake outer membrane protein [Bacteroidetes bacterium]|nr:MAG: RagB/SusD family nutrient uptake outer membrane protein [Bacteroidota bacterium]